MEVKREESRVAAPKKANNVAANANKDVNDDSDAIFDSFIGQEVSAGRCHYIRNHADTWAKQYHRTVSSVCVSQQAAITVAAAVTFTCINEATMC
uniref:Uncharacterized protein n=1 Tax=Setaria digitata TaxID=48799 RepID=A0A915PFW1_9BILA